MQLTRFIVFVVWLFVFAIAGPTMYAQPWESILDSSDMIRLENRAKLQANDPMQQRVDREIDEYRLLMLGHKWWNIPTDLEQQRIDFAKRAKFEPYNDSLIAKVPRPRFNRFYPTENKIKKDQNIFIMGWHPYWEGDAYKSYNYKLMTHMSYIGYEVNPFTGGYKTYEAVYEFEHSDVIQTAHMDSCQVLLNVSLRGEEEHEIFFTSEESVKKNLIDSLRMILYRSGADGLDLHFEDLPPEYSWEFVKFVRELSFLIREDDNSRTITMTLPLRDPLYAFDLEKLKPWIDIFVISTSDFHIKEDRLVEGPIAPLLDLDASIRGSLFYQEKYITLLDMMQSQYNVSDIELMHDADYIEMLRDSLNYFIDRYYENIEYQRYNLVSVLETLRMTRTEDGEPLWQQSRIQALLNRTEGIAKVYFIRDAKIDDPATQFFLFKPKRDSFSVYEDGLFGNMNRVQSVVDTQLFDINAAVAEYTDRLGDQHRSSLVLTLPYHGAVWYRNYDGVRDFKGYMKFSHIMGLIEQNQASVDYDKATQTLIATTRDSLGGIYKVYFDNATTLGHKYRFASNNNLAGIGVWPLGADYNHTSLWKSLEENFVNRRVWDADLGMPTQVSVEKGNKIHYTIQYLLKRYSPLTFATIFFVAIFICVSFGFSVLDWKVRDILFYTGSFRIFYVILFTVILLLIGNWLDIFQHKSITFALGTFLGFLLTWVASSMVDRDHSKLP